MITGDLSLIFNGCADVEDWWSYKNVISPFNRVYLITEGEAWVYLTKEKYHLTAGKLFMIPKFTFHTYECKHSMQHYYLCFYDEIAFCENMFDNYTFNFLVDAQKNDRCLFERLNEINPSGAIKDPDPAVYDNSKSLYLLSSKVLPNISVSNILEIRGILSQLVSRFIVDKEHNKSISQQHKRFGRLTSYIYQHLDKKITLDDLARIVCLSPDYLSKQFLQTMGVRPIEYINCIRVERAQMLLLTTNLSIKQIAERVGFSSNSYFSTMFKKQTGYSPEEFKHKQLK